MGVQQIDKMSLSFVEEVIMCFRHNNKAESSYDDLNLIVGRFSEMILAILLALDKPSSARQIRNCLEADLNKKVSIGALYNTLGRLEKRGLLESFMEGPTGEPGGRSKYLFALTHKGKESICAVKQFTDHVWRNKFTSLAHLFS